MRVIEKEIIVSASSGNVWQSWTTNEGVQAFFAPDADIELAVGGKYEIFFNHTLPYGQRGSEGCTILNYIPERLLSFSWNAPPSIPALRKSGEFTEVVLELSGDRTETKIKLSHFIAKEGEDWNRYYDYFTRAWEIVLHRLKERFETGPIHWESDSY